MKLFYILILILTSSFTSFSQCLITSTCGYTVEVNITPTAIIPSSSSCPFGYNYNVTFNYSIIVSGVNTCWNGNIGIQPQIFCNGGQNNGYYTINIPSPTVGTPSSSNSYTGTLTTTTNPYRNTSDCNTVPPNALKCNSVDITIYAPGISNQTINCNPSPLPIELYSFDVQSNDRKVYINYQTASEIKNDYFTIEKSKNGSNWEIVDKQNGAGNSSTLLSYHATDHTPYYGISYYRLKQTDFDGQYSYSSIRAVNIEPNTTEVLIYPNPTNNRITIQSGSSELSSFKIYNTLGQDVTSKTKQLTKSDNILILDLSFLAKGIYTVKTATTANIVYKQ